MSLGKKALVFCTIATVVKHVLCSFVTLRNPSGEELAKCNVKLTLTDRVLAKWKAKFTLTDYAINISTPKKKDKGTLPYACKLVKPKKSAKHIEQQRMTISVAKGVQDIAVIDKPEEPSLVVVVSLFGVCPVQHEIAKAQVVFQTLNKIESYEVRAGHNQPNLSTFALKVFPAKAAPQFYYAKADTNFLLSGQAVHIHTLQVFYNEGEYAVNEWLASKDAMVLQVHKAEGVVIQSTEFKKEEGGKMGVYQHRRGVSFQNGIGQVDTWGDRDESEKEVLF